MKYKLEPQHSLSIFTDSSLTEGLHVIVRLPQTCRLVPDGDKLSLQHQPRNLLCFVMLATELARFAAASSSALEPMDLLAEDYIMCLLMMPTNLFIRNRISSIRARDETITCQAPGYILTFESSMKRFRHWTNTNVLNNMGGGTYLINDEPDPEISKAEEPPILNRDVTNAVDQELFGTIFRSHEQSLISENFTRFITFCGVSMVVHPGSIGFDNIMVVLRII